MSVVMLSYRFILIHSTYVHVNTMLVVSMSPSCPPLPTSRAMHQHNEPEAQCAAASALAQPGITGPSFDPETCLLSHAHVEG